ncbi:hypothetical protein TVAG_278970 [Trichomonas vaginalis G3]|uniref:Uncharacterized protein n=1 Tax=Trichomonas vaginalis (strain ATCC PRA-98 / G3) TaxID=412133 RepID=A2G7L0_TRIV3|nr:hypothetical protein TVAGG3_0097840 [Trichomonas vaginalis G3]EAX86856.1 hypothetical protein TVAG_278970 [Trichomonas vaginalis G3]KAI5544226.1 hypothetical protein TVAGG3_0097840 [Trichomonas vaginalis G3]|eukprot:XP_001299786.1 hypothetical protein [Trichomonas vaginalis G3]
MSLINSSPLLAKGAQMTKKHLAPKSQANLESGLRVYQRILAKTDFNKPIFPITLESAEIFLLAYVKENLTATISTLQNHISALRQKIKEDSSFDYTETYQFKSFGIQKIFF